jgi:hypothetical protein
METSTKSTKKWVRHLGALGLETLHFAHALGGRRDTSERLMVIGTPEFEPWHFVAPSRRGQEGPSSRSDSNSGSLGGAERFAGTSGRLGR